ncbi:FkbM family methyltransferase [Erythrobacter sp. JK5]|uniref:FkbM family methyltransferase n=1 Tax=Erythrobacter sp. JK5 TaxID=2829500 RepID=UPI001BA62052|nr:FkbM family methyltransferase [Erythrobacter sp. JK5]QUL37953.1 FkbM family methyltransferase [Erythrobacter sp. JK5]
MSCEFLDFTFGRMGMLPRGIIHVGANSGQEVSEYAARGIRSAVLVEPQEEVFRALEREVSDAGKPGFVALQAACWREDGAMLDWHVASNEGLSSSLLEPSGHRAVHPEVQFETRSKIETRTLDRLLQIASADVAERCNALVLDVQGAELDVLAGATATLRQIDYIWIEVSWGGLYRGDSSLEEIIDAMRGYGFRMAHLAMTRWTWGNALFLANRVIDGLVATR